MFAVVYKNGPGFMGMDEYLCGDPYDDTCHNTSADLQMATIFETEVEAVRACHAKPSLPHFYGSKVESHYLASVVEIKYQTTIVKGPLSLN